MRIPAWLRGRRVAVFDLETTGHELRQVDGERAFCPEDSHIIQIAIMEVLGVGEDDGYVTESWSTLVKPEGKLANGHPVTIPKDATDIHGITNEMVADAPRFEEIAEKVEARMGGALVLGFNARHFDAPVLNVAFKRAKRGRYQPPDRVLDVRLLGLALDGWDAKGKGKGTLTAFCDRHGVSRVGLRAHDAGGDVEMTWRLFLRFCETRYHDLMPSASAAEVFRAQRDFAEREERSFQAWLKKKKAAEEKPPEEEMF